MKFIIAVIRHNCLEKVRIELERVGVHGLTVNDVRGFGRQKGRTELYRGAEYSVNFHPKVKIELAISDEIYEKALTVIRQASQSGKIGDGKIFVLDLEKVVRIRTGEEDEVAL